jgi:3-methylcrotonyl-CoA carboxylase beta subunit
MPANQSKNEGNDDQVFWAFSMIAAAEYGLPDPPSDKPGWLAMTQSVFNQFVGRFNKEIADGNCGGGMRWQIYSWLNGWNYKNTASNGGLFHLGARLAMYTKNDTYARWAEKSYDWMAEWHLLAPDGQVNDGTDMMTNPPCKDADHTQWTYNYGMIIAGAAYVCCKPRNNMDLYLTVADVQLHKRGREMEIGTGEDAQLPRLPVLSSRQRKGHGGTMRRSQGCQGPVQL